MTELHWGLMGLGVVVVASIVVYNAWQEYRHRKEFSDSGISDDPLFGGIFRKKTKPGALDELLPPLPGTASDLRAKGTDPRIEPGLKKERPPPEGESSVFPEIDCIAAFEVKKTVSARRIVECARGLLAGISKPMTLLGYDRHFLCWEPLIEGGRNEYPLFRVGVQLVDRRGAITEDDLSMFHQAMRHLAEEMSADVILPDMSETLETVARLDAFAESVDILVGINVIAGTEAFSGKKLERLAEVASMTLESDGRFVCRDAEGVILYSLINRESPVFSSESIKTLSTRGMTFLLDVPRTENAERAFEQMIGVARQFAVVLKGTLVDDQGREVSEVSLEPVRNQIVQCQSAMAASGLPAGGERARRLFS